MSSPPSLGESSDRGAAGGQLGGGDGEAGSEKRASGNAEPVWSGATSLVRLAWDGSELSIKEAREAGWILPPGLEPAALSPDGSYLLPSGRHLRRSILSPRLPGSVFPRVRRPGPGVR